MTKKYNYNPLDPKGLANILEAALEEGKNIGKAGADFLEQNVKDFKVKDRINTPKVRRRKKLEMLEAKTMMKEDVNVNKLKNKNNISSNNIMSFRRAINSGININKQSSTMSDKLQAEEIPIAPIPKALSSIVPDYFTIRMPARTVDTLSVIKGTSTYDSMRITLNDLNSPFSNATTIDYLGTSQWKSFFQFYKIVENRITVTFHNTTADNTDFVKTNDYITEFNARVGFELTDSSSARLITSRQQAEGKHNITTVIKPAGAGNGSDSYEMTYIYRPDEFIKQNSHISQNDEGDRWTAISTAPPHSHYCHVGITENIGNIITTGSILRVNVDVKAEVVVQFREVTDSILTTSQNS